MFLACNSAESSLTKATQSGAVFAQVLLPSTKANPSKSRSIPSYLFTSTKSEIVFAILVSFSTLIAYVHWKPFENDKDDKLAIVTQISVFFTLLSALLTKVQVDKTDGYNQLFFGILLICLNSSGVVMVIGMALAEPIVSFGQLIFATNHSHDGSLRGMNVAETTEKKGFIDHFIQVSLSDEKEGGWKNFYKPVKRWTEFFNYSNAEIAFRNSNGNGPIDEYRVKFQTQAPLNIVMDYVLNKKRTKRCYEKESYVCGGDNSTSHYKQYYVVEKMGRHFRDRDMLVEEHSGMVDFEGKAFGFIARRSISNDEVCSLKKTSTMKRVRGEVIMAGYVFQEEQGSKGAELTSVIYLENIDWGGVFKGLLMNGIVPNNLMLKVDDMLAFVEEENGEIGSSSKSNSEFGSSESGGDNGGGVELLVIGGQNQKSRELRAASGGNIGLGSEETFSKHEKYKKQDANVFKEELKNPVFENSSLQSNAKKKTAAAKDSGISGVPSHISKFNPGDFRASEIKGGGRKRGDSARTGRSDEKAVEVGEAAGVPSRAGGNGGEESKTKSSRWSTGFDETHGSVYYYDIDTHETALEKPEDFDE